MRRIGRSLVLSLCLCCAAVAQAADLVTLSPENYREYAPAGKEVDAVFGDYVLRNDRIVVVVADPTLMVGRSGSRKYGMRLEGNIIDLTLRDRPNDLLGTYDPTMIWPQVRRIVPQGIPGEPHHQIGFKDEGEAHKQPGREPQRGRRVTLTLPFEPPIAEVRYSLEDGWPYVLIETVFRNGGDKPLKLAPYGCIYVSPRKLDGSDQYLHGLSRDGRFGWIYDPWFAQAYALVTDDLRMEQPLFARRPSWLAHTFHQKGGKGITVAPGETFVLQQKLLPAANLFDARAAFNDLSGVRQRRVRVTVTDPDGPVTDADVVVRLGKEVCGAGRTGADGTLQLSLPDGDYELTVSPPGRAAQKLTLDPARQTDCRVECEAAARVRFKITAEDGGPIPCKVEFRGLDGTPDPFFFPVTGEHFVRNLCYTHTGSFRRIVPPGAYEVIVTHGPEYDAVTRRIEAVRGKEVALEATLVRSVDTGGWISADFGNRSTVSRPFSDASQLGRVLNLLGEHVEFAPATERDFVSDFTPYLEALGAQRLMATCPGIGLTQRVRKTWTSQNSFPVIHVPGAQDGGALQRPQHVFQVFWLGGWYGELTVHGSPSWIPATDKLIQVTPPSIWPNDGRSDGMYNLFYPWRWSHEDPHRNGRLSILHYMDAMEVQPLEEFLELPAWNAKDPKGEEDLQDWWRELEDRRSRNWPAGPKRGTTWPRNRRWTRILGLGYRMTGVVNSNAYYNFHGSGGLRNFVKSPTDDPAAVKPLDVVHAVRFGHVVMSTGPFLEVELDAAQKGPQGHGIPGDDVSAPGGAADLHVRVQCPNWITADRVQVLFNGMRAEELNFTRADNAKLFRDGPLQFDHTVRLDLPVDTHVMVIVTGEGPNLRARRGEDDLVQRHIAMSNPIWVDVGGDGFKPHSPIDDEVYAFFDVLKPLKSDAKAGPARVRLYLKNLGDREARDALTVRIHPAGAAKITGAENRFEYRIAPGEQVTWDFDLELSKDFAGKRIMLQVPRSSVGVGRRAVGKRVVVDGNERPWTTMTAAQRRSVWWLPEHVSTRPPDWGRSHRWRARNAQENNPAEE